VVSGFPLEPASLRGYLAAMPTRVILTSCPDYADVAAALPRLLDTLGGMGAFVRAGQSVLIKPNLLTDARPDEAVTTHPEVVRAVIRLVKAAGAHPWVADSPANVADLARVWERTGVQAICREEDVPLVNLEKAGSERFEVEGVQFTIARPVLDADAVITVPKVKTHLLTGYTGAVKNLYGVVPGLQKTSLHKQYPRMDDFSKMLVMVFGRIRPVLAIADGVVGMEGNGPSAGTPVRLGYLAASADSVALDAVLCRTLGLEARQVRHLQEAHRAGLGEVDRDRITVEGDGLAALGPRKYSLPDTVPTHLIPRWAARLVKPLIWHRPDFTARCVFCGQCVKACPVGALRIERGQRPTLTPSTCIACCCCHEICPARAIEMRGSPLVKLIGRLRPKR
jgi:uncharacterized protein (DUF362 family)/Pyruvate/2-oxoacid:ferredoxin oxidoreductase delta subunit